jgi:cyanate permease
MNKITSTRLTTRYSIHQFLFFAVCAGIAGFGVTYLLDQGFTASQAGTVLSVSSIISCLIQPLLGDIFDRLKRFVLPQIVGTIFLMAGVSFAVMQIVKPPLLVFGILYGTGNFFRRKKPEYLLL